MRNGALRHHPQPTTAWTWVNLTIIFNYPCQPAIARERVRVSCQPTGGVGQRREVVATRSTEALGRTPSRQSRQMP
jgi:hypothetical protein